MDWCFQDCEEDFTLLLGVPFVGYLLAKGSDVIFHIQSVTVSLAPYQ